VLEAIVGDTAGGRVEPAWWDRQLLERFWFEDDTQWAPIGTLSGGERRRLQLLLVLSGRPNVLLLDEPTNDLDLDTLRALEDFLEDWPGALVVVSHDRAFLERAVEDVLVLERGADGGSGTAGRRPGGYAAWEAERRAGRSLGSAARASAAARPAAPRPKGVSASALRSRVARLEAELATLTARRDALAAELATAGADHGELTRLSVALGEVDDAVTRTEEAWLEAAETLEALA
jgi:ATP-binding cassette subfamily F protein uup